MLALPRPLLRWLVCLIVSASFLGVPLEGFAASKAQAGGPSVLKKATTDSPVSAKKKKKKKKHHKKKHSKKKMKTTSIR